MKNNSKEVLLLCRIGFEKECSAELIAKGAEFGFTAFAKAKENSGYARVIFHECPFDNEQLGYALRAKKLIFTRQLFVIVTELKSLPEADRISPIIAAITDNAICKEWMPGTEPLCFGHVRVETADTNEARELLPFCSSFGNPLRQHLKKAKLLVEHKGPGLQLTPTLHILFFSYSDAIVGVSTPKMSSPWDMGIPRFKFPSAAPSRSTLKLDEAFSILLPSPVQKALLAPGKTAVDLGAAPGGWCYQFIRRHMDVIAVDNANVAQSLIETGLCTHVREDGFRYRPKKPVTWMVCDMAEQPSRIAALAADWLVAGQCEASLFNLKLPMKKRLDEVMLCLNKLKETLMHETNIEYVVRCKHLYHDREEVTVAVYPTKVSR